MLSCFNTDEKNFVTNNSFINNQYGLYVKDSQFIIIDEEDD